MLRTSHMAKIWDMPPRGIAMERGWMREKNHKTQIHLSAVFEENVSEVLVAVKLNKLKTVRAGTSIIFYYINKFHG